MSTSVVRKDSLKSVANLRVTSDRVPALNIQDLTKRNPAWVVSAVHKLKEIDFHLQNKEIDQHKKISDNINNVISCLQTLDNCRLQLHEELEKEAITTFSLYHTIKTLPSSIKVEINAAVEAAHSQNEIDIASKTAVLSELEDKICTLRDEQLKLEKDNNSLLPQRNLIRKQHDGLVINLNKLLEEKSRIQIDVNETREKIRQHNQEIVETEITIQELKTKLYDEHDQANRKIQNYKCDIEKIQKKKEQWDKKNLTVSQQLSEVNAELTECKLALKELQNNEKIQEKAVLDLKKQNQHLNLQIQAEITAQEHLANTKKKLTETLRKVTKKNAGILSEKTKILDDMKVRVDYETKQNKELQQSEEDQQNVIVECTDAEKEAKKEVEELETKLHSKQLELSEHTEKLASLDSDNTRNKDAIRKMIENHGLLIAQFNREIEKRKAALKEEKQLRSDAQRDRDSLTQKMRTTEGQKVKYASKMKQKISELKEQFTKKSIAGKELQKDVQDKNEALQKLDEETKCIEKTMKELAEEKEQLIKQTKDAIAVFEETIKERTKILEDITPSYEEVEKKYKKQSKIYEERKDAFSTKRRNEINLKKDLHQTQKNLDEMKMMQEKEQQQIKVTQNEYLSILNSNSEESKLLEEDIYVQSCKLKSIIEENHTLKKGIDGLEKGIIDTDQCIEEGKKLHRTIIEELVETRRKLTNSFKETTMKEETLNCRDTEMMHQLSGVLSILNHNSKQVNSVAEGLFKQLEGLGIYLDQVCNKRAQ